MQARWRLHELPDGSFLEVRRQTSVQSSAQTGTRRPPATQRSVSSLRLAPRRRRPTAPHPNRPPPPPPPAAPQEIVTSAVAHCWGYSPIILGGALWEVDHVGLGHVRRANLPFRPLNEAHKTPAPRPYLRPQIACLRQGARAGRPGDYPPLHLGEDRVLARTPTPRTHPAQPASLPCARKRRATGCACGVRRASAAHSNSLPHSHAAPAARNPSRRPPQALPARGAAPRDPRRPPRRAPGRRRRLPRARGAPSGRRPGAPPPPPHPQRRARLRHAVGVRRHGPPEAPHGVGVRRLGVVGVRQLGAPPLGGAPPGDGGARRRRGVRQQARGWPLRRRRHPSALVSQPPHSACAFPARVSRAAKLSDTPRLPTPCSYRSDGCRVGSGLKPGAPPSPLLP